MNARRVEIIGGGLAGLALGLALRRANVPVTLFEAGRYPRHRVCGEFISGLDEETSRWLALEPFLANAGRASEAAVYLANGLLRRYTLPQPAYTISREVLDANLAKAFVETGGELVTGTRVDLGPAPAGRVFCTGRRRSPSPWIGLKCHVHNLPLQAELELHLGNGAYVGLCQVSENRVNVCGLFHRRIGVAGDRTAMLAAYMRAAGLENLAERFELAEAIAPSWSAVAGIGFDPRIPRSNRIQLGDALAVIAPFTGNGMAMALQSARAAVDPLTAWANSERSWEETVAAVQSATARRFRRRLRVSAWIHPLLFSPSLQRRLSVLRHRGFLPFGPIYRLTH